MGLPSKTPIKRVENFKWEDLHKRIVQIIHMPAVPDCLEFVEEVWAVDPQTCEYFVLHKKLLEVK